MIYTHVNVDLDAIISVNCYCLKNNTPITSQTVQFVPAAWTEFPEHAVLIDVETGKHDLARSHVGQYFEDDLPFEVVREVDFQDSTGLSTGFAPMQMILLGMKKSNQYDDLGLVQAFTPIVRGWFKMAEDRKNAQAYFETKAQKIQVGIYKFMVADNQRIPDGVMGYALNAGYVGTIYVNGYNMGITRYPTVDNTPDLSKLPCPKDWFQHPKGFLLCWGSHKSPARKNNPQFPNLPAFIVWLNTNFERYRI